MYYVWMLPAEEHSLPLVQRTRDARAMGMIDSKQHEKRLQRMRTSYILRSTDGPFAPSIECDATTWPMYHLPVDKADKAMK